MHGLNNNLDYKLDIYKSEVESEIWLGALSFGELSWDCIHLLVLPNWQMLWALT